MPEDLKMFQDMKILQQVLGEAIKRGNGVSLNVITVQQLTINFNGKGEKLLVESKNRNRSQIAKDTWARRKELQAAKL